MGENEGGGSDSLIFFDITRDRLSFSKEENDLIINIDNDANQGVRVKNYFLNDEYALDMIQPGDQKPAYTKNDIDNIVNAFDKPTLTEDKNANIIDTALNPYSGKYQGQRGATGSRVYMDIEAK